MTEEQVRGMTLHGDEPKRLELSDGSRLMLDAASDEDARSGGTLAGGIGA